MLALRHASHKIDGVVRVVEGDQLLLRVIRETITDVFVIYQFLARQISSRQHENWHVIGIVSDVSKYDISRSIRTAYLKEFLYCFKIGSSKNCASASSISLSSSLYKNKLQKLFN